MKNTTTILKIGKNFFTKNIINILFFSLAIYILTLGSNSNGSGPEIVFLMWDKGMPY